MALGSLISLFWASPNQVVNSVSGSSGLLLSNIARFRLVLRT